MSSQPRCTCSSCTIRGMMGPAVVTSLGILFLLSELRHGSASIGHTFPILFIVMGIILLASAVAPKDGHINSPVFPAQSGAPPAPPASYSNAYPGQRQ